MKKVVAHFVTITYGVCCPECDEFQYIDMKHMPNENTITTVVCDGCRTEFKVEFYTE